MEGSGEKEKGDGGEMRKRSEEEALDEWSK